MLDLKAWIAKVTDYVNETYITETVTVSYSFSSQRYKSITQSVAKTGYTPIGVVGWTFAQVDWIFSKVTLNGNTLEMTIFRSANTTASTNVKVDVLYRKVGGVVRKLLNSLTLERGWAV